MDHETEQALGTLPTRAAQPAPVPAPEPKPDTDLNQVSRAPNLRFPVPSFFTDDPNLWFFQLEATFIVNRVTFKFNPFSLFLLNESF